jgi:hypothetical protein
MDVVSTPAWARRSGTSSSWDETYLVAMAVATSASPTEGATRHNLEEVAPSCVVERGRPNEATHLRQLFLLTQAEVVGPPDFVAYGRPCWRSPLRFQQRVTVVVDLLPPPAAPRLRLKGNAHVVSCHPPSTAASLAHARPLATMRGTRPTPWRRLGCRTQNRSWRNQQCDNLTRLFCRRQCSVLGARILNEASDDTVREGGRGAVRLHI